MRLLADLITVIAMMFLLALITTIIATKQITTQDFKEVIELLSFSTAGYVNHRRRTAKSLETTTRKGTRPLTIVLALLLAAMPLILLLMMAWFAR